MTNDFNVALPFRCSTNADMSFALRWFEDISKLVMLLHFNEAPKAPKVPLLAGCPPMSFLDMSSEANAPLALLALGVQDFQM